MSFKYTIQCPACRQKLRIPFSFNTLKITCPRCSAIFMFKLEFKGFFKRILDFILKPFKKPTQGVNGFKYNYSDTGHSSHVVKIFWIWGAVLLFLILFSVVLKNISNNRLLKQTSNENIFYHETGGGQENKKKII